MEAGIDSKLGSSEAQAEYFDGLWDTSTEVIRASHARSETCIRIGDIHLKLSTAGDDLLTRATSAFTFQQPAPARATNEQAWQVLLWSEQETQTQFPASPSPTLTIAKRSEVDGFTRGDIRLAYSIDSQILTAASMSQRRAVVVARRLDRLTGFEYASPLRTLLGWILPSRGYLLLHGAAIARDGRAALLVGSSGAGKSTLALAAFQEGWVHLGDDLVALRLQDQTIHSVYRSAKTLEWSTLHESIEPQRDLSRSGEKLVHLLPRPAGDLTRDGIRLGGAFRIVQSTRSDVQPIATAAVAAVVGSSTHTLLPGSGEELLRGLHVALQDVPAWELEVGPNPHESLRLIDQVME